MNTTTKRGPPLRGHELLEDPARFMPIMYGLIEPSRTDLSPSQKAYAHKAEPTKELKAVEEAFKPTVPIGVSTTGGAFTEDVVRAVAKNVELTCKPEYDWPAGDGRS